jgi:hypothetical protein
MGHHHVALFFPSEISFIDKPALNFAQPDARNDER